MADIPKGSKPPLTIGSRANLCGIARFFLIHRHIIQIAFQPRFLIRLLDKMGAEAKQRN